MWVQELPDLFVCHWRLARQCNRTVRGASSSWHPKTHILVCFPYSSCYSFSLIPIFPRQQLPHALHQWSLVVVPVKGGSHAHRIAEEEALVQRLPSPERAAGNIPGKPEELDPIPRVHVGDDKVLLKVFADRAVECRLWRDHHHARRA